MNIRQIRQLMEHNGLPDTCDSTQLIETHISWVILTDNFAFKIKKPNHYSFLDFSTLNKRKFYCEQELRLNRRLAPEVYLEVLPIFAKEGCYAVGEPPEDGVIIDYTLKLKKLDPERRMDLLLEKEEVSVPQVLQIAERLADFHKEYKLTDAQPNLMEMQDDFADILKIKNFLSAHLGATAVRVVERSVEFSQQFLKQFKGRMEQRYDLGYIVDGHGDLHSQNIFLCEKPVIFDCIEFNEHFRRLDALSEIAFFCMDLAFNKQSKLEAPFLGSYLAHFPCIQEEADWEIFHYFKLYRANVRLKVSALATTQVDNQEAFERHLSSVQRYYDLLKAYLQSATIKAVW